MILTLLSTHPWHAIATALVALLWLAEPIAEWLLK